MNHNYSKSAYTVCYRLGNLVCLGTRFNKIHQYFTLSIARQHFTLQHTEQSNNMVIGWK